MNWLVGHGYHYRELSGIKLHRRLAVFETQIQDVGNVCSVKGREVLSINVFQLLSSDGTALGGFRICARKLNIAHATANDTPMILLLNLWTEISTQ